MKSTKSNHSFFLEIPYEDDPRGDTEHEIFVLVPPLQEMVLIKAMEKAGYYLRKRTDIKVFIKLKFCEKGW